MTRHTIAMWRLCGMRSAATRGDVLSMLISIYGSKEKLIKVSGVLKLLHCHTPNA
jgi:hypothetical protein